MSNELTSKKILAVALIALLAVVAFSTAAPAFSKEQSENAKEKGEKGKNKGEKGQDQEETSTSQTGTNSTDTKSKGQSNTNSTSQSNSKAKGQKGEKSIEEQQESHDKVKEKAMETHGKKNAEARHLKHLAKNATTIDAYNANMNFTLTASGTAKSIADNSTRDITITMDLSVWKSTKGQVSMDIMRGTIKIGDNETYDINAGSILYLIKPHKIVVTGFINSKDIRIMKLQIAVPKDSELSTATAEKAMQLNILSPRSKLASKWMLEMQGEITPS